ncbi:hypothetical protein NESM_000855900 [Novymonas esmeraldas]|uniref:Uncharacterized protein n=1 Tax=Novymonas esmeraldas TaxID=1808958 RepID=A0AAW0EXN6_9TRYP
MWRCSPRLAPVASARALLSPYGIGVSRRLARVGDGNSVVALQVTENVQAGTPLLVVPDGALLTCQVALDADRDGLVPPPAEVVEMLKRDTEQLDRVYLALYLSLHYFTDHGSWFADQIRRYHDSGSRYHDLDAAGARVWEVCARQYVTAPLPVYLAALRYVGDCGFRKPPAPADASTAPSPAVLAVAPGLDAAARSSGATNAALSRTTAKIVRETYLRCGITGARQALAAKDDACSYLVLTTTADIPAGRDVSLCPSG